LQKSKSLGRSTLAEAKARRDELAVSIRRGEFVQPSKQTLAEWLNVWLDESVRSARRGNTVLSYQSLIANHIIPALGGVQLQALRSGHLSKYYAEKARAGLSSGTLGVHHAVLSSALSSAVKQGLVTRNVAALVDAKPKARTDRGQGKQHCWSAEDAQSFPPAAADAGPQLAALFSLALNSGARRGELLGARWADVDLDAGTLGRCMSRAASMTGRGLVTPAHSIWGSAVCATGVALRLSPPRRARPKRTATATSPGTRSARRSASTGTRTRASKWMRYSALRSTR
jgi:integrase